MGKVGSLEFLGNTFSDTEVLQRRKPKWRLALAVRSGNSRDLPMTMLRMSFLLGCPRKLVKG